MANKIYNHPETAITWRASGGDLVLTLTSLGTSAGRQGAAKDFGSTTARSRRFVWRAFVKLASSPTPTVGDVIDIYVKTGDGTHRDNDDGTGDLALSHVDKLNNLRWIGAIIIDEASATPEFSASGVIEVDAQEFFPVIYNGTNNALSSTAGDHGFDLKPVPPEVQ